MSALAVSSVSKKFGDFSVLKDVNFSIEKGESRAIIGPNGAGKTTLVNIISGVFPPSSGSVMLGTQNITGLEPHKVARLGLVRTYQITSLFNEMSATENVEVALIGRAKYRSGSPTSGESPSTAAEILDLLGLRHAAGKRVHDLAHGDQRLLEVAIAIALDPEVLLLDEPTAGMSPGETRGFINLVNDRLRGRQTIVLIEHDMEVVMNTADRVCVLAQGEVIANDTPKAISENSFVKEAYLGHS
jgi:branched-chain amino acid transport system ATP-binding protein